MGSRGPPPAGGLFSRPAAVLSTNGESSYNLSHFLMKLLKVRTAQDTNTQTAKNYPK